MSEPKYKTLTSSNDCKQVNEFDKIQYCPHLFLCKRKECYDCYDSQSHVRLSKLDDIIKLLKLKFTKKK